MLPTLPYFTGFCVEFVVKEKKESGYVLPGQEMSKVGNTVRYEQQFFEIDFLGF